MEVFDASLVKDRGGQWHDEQLEDGIYSGVEVVTEKRLERMRSAWVERSLEIRIRRVQVLCDGGGVAYDFRRTRRGRIDDHRKRECSPSHLSLEWLQAEASESRRYFGIWQIYGPVREAFVIQCHAKNEAQSARPRFCNQRRGAGGTNRTFHVLGDHALAPGDSAADLMS